MCVAGTAGSTVPLSFFKARVVLRTLAGEKPQSPRYQLGIQKSGALHAVHFPDRAGKGDKAERSGHSGGEGLEMLKVKRPKYL